MKLYRKKIISQWTIINRGHWHFFCYIYGCSEVTATHRLKNRLIKKLLLRKAIKRFIWNIVFLFLLYISMAVFKWSYTKHVYFVHWSFFLLSYMYFYNTHIHTHIYITIRKNPVFFLFCIGNKFPLIQLFNINNSLLFTHRYQRN